MSIWWDDHAQKYRSSLVYKVFYVWGWPVARWVMFNCMSSEAAHLFALHWAIPMVGWIERAYQRVIGILLLPVVILFVIVVRVLCLLPWFTFEPPAPETPDGK